jgi:hypothetical protein
VKLVLRTLQHQILVVGVVEQAQATAHLVQLADLVLLL